MNKSIYFVRHAEPNYNNHDDQERELTAKGEKDCELVVEFFANRVVDGIYSSPFKRAYDTVKDIAIQKNLPIIKIDEFRERKIADGWIEEFNEFSQKQWQDFDYHLINGESLAQVQCRNINALSELLKNPQKSIVVGSHGTALATVINYYQSNFGYNDYFAIKSLFPFIVQFDFDGLECCTITFYDILYNTCKTLK